MNPLKTLGHFCPVSLSAATIVLSILCLASTSVRATTINAVPVNGSYDSISGDYSVSVDDGSGGSTTAVSVINHYVEYPAGTVHKNVYFGQFSFGGGNARVQVTLNSFSGSSSYTYTLSPQSYGITSSKSGNVITFTLTQAAFVMLKVTDSANTYPYYLIIIADPLESSAYTVPASSGTGIYNITASPYSASGTYSTDCSAAINSAITDAAAYYASSGNDGIVYVPYSSSGAVYKLSASIIPKSHVKLYVAPGAILRADTGWTGGHSNWGTGSTYYLLKEAGDSGSPLFGALTDFTVYGRGCFDCKGVAVGGDAASKSAATPQSMCAFEMTDTSGVTVNGVLIRESTGLTFWNDRSQNLNYIDVKVINYAQDFNNYRENDGLDMMQCQDSSVNHFLAFTADDACCIKGGDDAGDGALTANNIVYNDAVIYTGADGCKLGADAYTDITNCYFSDIQIVSAKRPLGIYAEGGKGTASSWSNNGFLGINCEIVSSGGEPIQFQVTNSATAVTNTAITDFTTVAGPNASEITGDSAAGTISGVVFADLSIGGTVYSSTPPTSVIDPNSYTSSISYNTDGPLIQGLTASSYSSNWVLTGDQSLTQINDGSTATEGHANNTSSAQVVYNLVSNHTFDHAEVYQDNGTYSAQSWTLEYWNNTTHAWVTVFTNYPCTTAGWNTVYFPPVVGTAVRITFNPYAGEYVGINEVEVYGR